MSAATAKHEHIIRSRFTVRLREWWGDDAAEEVVSAGVDELMTDLNYTIKPVSIRKRDPEAYRMARREYMRAYQRTRRAKEEVGG